MFRPSDVYLHSTSANFDLLFQCKQFTDGQGVVMDNFEVGGIDTASKYDKSHMFFDFQQNVDPVNFVASGEVSRTSDEYGYCKNNFTSMNKEVSSLSARRTCEVCKRSQASKGQWTAQEDG